MKKINTAHSGKDRIICVTTDKHRFYYQPAAAKERYWLFDTAGVTVAVGAFFRSRGIRTGSNGFSLTLDELYRARACRGRVLAHVLERIPAQVDYVLKYERSAARAA